MQSHPDQKEKAAESSPPTNPLGEWLLSIISRIDEITGTPDTSCMVRGMLELILEITRADSANFFQLDEDTGEILLTHSCGDVESQNMVSARLNLQQYLPEITPSVATTLESEDSPTDLDWLQAFRTADTARRRNVINLPVSNQASTHGFIQIFNFHQSQLDLLSVIGHRLAIELDHRKDIEAVNKSNQRLLKLVDMLGNIAGTLNRNHLSRLVTEYAARLVGADHSSLSLVDPSTNEIIFHVAYHQPETERMPSPAGIKPGQANFNRSKPLNASNSTRQPNLADLVQGEFSYYNRSAISVPLKSEMLAKTHAEDRKHVLGGLMVLNQSHAAFQEEDAQLIQILANQASTFLQVSEIFESTEELFLGAIKSLTEAIDAKDPYTQGHSQRVSDYSVQIARELGLDEMSVNDICIGSLLHDIGKIGMPDSVLLKNSKLTKEEYDLIKQHPRTGANIISQVKLLSSVQPAILEHHERLDGSGYPAKLTNSQISIMGKIVAVADVFDAMTSNRPYRKALSHAEVLSYLHESSGKLFDPTCVMALDTVICSAA
jgi:putative nucleotidyltransferase with HDIG domain